MVAYRALDSDEMKDGDMPRDITHKIIEKMQKIVSSHHNKILKEEGFDVVAVVKSESKTVPRKQKQKTESLEGKKAKK